MQRCSGTEDQVTASFIRLKERKLKFCYWTMCSSRELRRKALGIKVLIEGSNEQEKI